MNNMVKYNGRWYRTLEDSSPLDGGWCSLDQDYKYLPSGWELAADNADSLYVISSYRWGAIIMAVAGGNGYFTLSGPSCCDETPGKLYTSSALSTSGSAYMGNDCAMLILISKPAAAIDVQYNLSLHNGANVFIRKTNHAKPAFASITTRHRAPVGSSILPSYIAHGGPHGKGHVTFDRLLSQFLDAGPRTLNIATNGGLTIVAVVRFTGDIANSERIIDLASGKGVNNLMVTRPDSATDLRIELWNSGSQTISSTLSGVNVQNTWLTAVVRYRASTREWWFTVNGVAASAGTASASLTDRSLSLTYMGRSQWSGDAYFNGDMAGVFVVDEYLSTNATSAIADLMVWGVDLTSTTPTVICVCLCIYTHTHTQQQQYHDLYSSTGRVCMSRWSHVIRACDCMPS